MPSPVIIYSEPGIFNVLDQWYFNGVEWVGMIAKDNSAATAEQNAAVLQAIINLAQTTNCDQSAGYGAIILFPGHSSIPDPTGTGDDLGGAYFIALPTGEDITAAVTIDCNWPLRFLGTGSAILHMVANSNGDFGDMFAINTSGEGDNTGGICFEDLVIKYDTIPDQTTEMYYSAVHTVPGSVSGAGGAENVRLRRVGFQDCPIGCWFEEALHPSMIDCTITWDNNFGIGVMLGDGSNGKGSAKQVYIAGCLISASKAATSGQTAIQIGACDGVRVESCQIDSPLSFSLG